MKKIVKLASLLAVFCAVSAGALAFVYIFTRPQIELYARRTFEAALKEALPGASSFKEVKKDEQVYYVGMDGGKKAGAAFPVSPRGYSDSIGMLVGVGEDKKVAGVKILSQRETPGLGANIVNPKFLSQFVGKSANDPIEPKKDIDALTGATISSKAVSKGVRDALERF